MTETTLLRWSGNDEDVAHLAINNVVTGLDFNIDMIKYIRNIHYPGSASFIRPTPALGGLDSVPLWHWVLFMR